ncbi:Uncharacterised protein [uncultured archaeon]|nr:Uncharacterised protein [uncultured archaeon]
MKKALSSLILSAGLFFSCSQKEYTKEEVLNNIEKERTFSEQKYKKYYILKVENYEDRMIEEYYDFDRDGNMDVATISEFGLFDSTKDKPFFIGVCKKNNSKFNIFYSDLDGDGILEEKAGK